MLIGNSDTSSTSSPRVNPNLQNRSVLGVDVGYNHRAALLDCGKLLTWGIAMASGMGDPYQLEPGQPGGFASETDKIQSLRVPVFPPDIRQPTEVRFDHELVKPRERFVSAVATSAYHIGALVVDLEEVQS